MLTRKLIVKDLTGKGIGVARLTFGQSITVELPKGMIGEYYEREGEVRPFSGEIPLAASGSRELSLLGSFSGSMVFATTLTGEAATFAKWRLAEKAKERDRDPILPPKNPLPETADEILPSEEKEEGSNAPFEVIDLAPPKIVDPLRRAEELLAKGSPFPLFRDLMPNARWAMIEGEEAPFLFGILDEKPPKFLLGIAGRRDLPPEEEGLWSFFPTDEEDETGYFLTEAKENLFPV